MRSLRLFVFGLLFVLAGQAAYAQFSLGLKAGLNFASIDTSDPTAAYNSRTGYHIGAFARFKFSKLAIQPELVYSQQGSTVKVTSTTFDQNFSYVNVPILLKLYLIGGLNLQAGPQIGFLTSATQGGVDVKSLLKSSDFSAALGVGWDLPLKLNVDFRYNLGLSNVSDGSSGYDYKNQVFQLSVGFRLLGD